MRKNTFLLLAAAVSLLTMGAGCGEKNTDKQPGYESTPPASAPSASSTDGTDDLAISAIIEAGVEDTKTNTGVVTNPTKNYVAALKIYQESGYRFQFSNCSGNPGSLTLKKGTKFMLDNRDNETHQIGIGTKSYELKPYAFAVVSVQKAGSYNITCDGGGAARVDIQN